MIAQPPTPTLDSAAMFESQAEIQLAIRLLQDAASRQIVAIRAYEESRASARQGEPA